MYGFRNLVTLWTLGLCIPGSLCVVPHTNRGESTLSGTHCCNRSSRASPAFEENASAKMQIIAYLDIHEIQGQGCGGLNPDMVQMMEAIRWTVNMINVEDYDGQHALGLKVYDACKLVNKQNFSTISLSDWHRTYKPIGLLATSDIDTLNYISTLHSLTNVPLVVYDAYLSASSIMQTKADLLIGLDPTALFKVLNHILHELGHNFVTMVTDEDHASFVESLLFVVYKNDNRSFCVPNVIQSANATDILNRLSLFPGIRTVIAAFTIKNLHKFLEEANNEAISDITWVMLSTDFISEDTLESFKERFVVPANILIVQTEHYKIRQFRDRMSKMDVNLKKNPFIKEYHDWLYRCLANEWYSHTDTSDCDDIIRQDFQNGFHQFRGIDDIIRGIKAITYAAAHPMCASGICSDKMTISKKLKGSSLVLGNAAQPHELQDRTIYVDFKSRLWSDIRVTWYHVNQYEVIRNMITTCDMSGIQHSTHLMKDLTEQAKPSVCSENCPGCLCCSTESSHKVSVNLNTLHRYYIKLIIHDDDKACFSAKDQSFIFEAAVGIDGGDFPVLPLVETKSCARQTNTLDADPSRILVKIHSYLNIPSSAIHLKSEADHASSIFHIDPSQVLYDRNNRKVKDNAIPLDKVSQVLNSFHWSYIHIVYSEPDSKTFNEVKEYLVKNHNICISSSFALPSYTRASQPIADFWDYTIHSLLRHLSQASQSPLEEAHHPPVVLLLIDKEQTESLLRALSTGGSLFPVLWIAAYPMTLKAAEVPASHTVIVLERVPQPWDVVHDKRHCQDNNLLNHIKITTELIKEALLRIYDRQCPENLGMCAQMLNAMGPEYLFQELMNVEPSQFGRWNSDGQMQFSYYVSVHRMVGGQKRNDKIGQFSMSGALFLNRSLITFTKGGSTRVYIPPAICMGWCPQCWSCDHKNEYNAKQIKSAGISGDLTITAFIPVQKVSCKGQATTEEHFLSQSLLEAFLHSIQTLPSRLPSLTLLQNARLGGLVIDSCNDTNIAIHRMMDFKNCDATYFIPEKNQSVFSVSNLAYLDVVGNLFTEKNEIGKILISPEPVTNKDAVYVKPSYQNEANAVISFLVHHNLTRVGIVQGSSPIYSASVQAFMALSYETDICISSIIEDSHWDAIPILLENNASVILIYANESTTLHLLEQFTQNRNQPTIFVLFQDNFKAAHVRSVSNALLGSIAVVSNLDSVDGFKKYFESIHPDTSYHNPWLKEFFESQFNCSISAKVHPPDILDNNDDLQICSGHETLPASKVHPHSFWIQTAVDSFAMALDEINKRLCVGKAPLCDEFVKHKDMRKLIRQTIYRTSRKIKPSYTIYNYRRGKNELGLAKYVEIATFDDEQLLLNKSSSLLFYDVHGYAEDPHWFDLGCGDNCHCINLSTFSTRSQDFREEDFDRELVYVTDLYFRYSIWVSVVLTVSVIGVLVTIVILIYVCYHKMTSVTRNGTGIGLLLLIGVMLLYLSVFPYAFHPNEFSCGFRICTVSFSYCFCFGALLIKAMTMRNLKYIGLGGELSSLNQLLTFIFIVTVQVSVLMQWWLMKSELVAFAPNIPSSPWHVDIDDPEWADYHIPVCSHTRFHFLCTMVYPVLLELGTVLYAAFVRRIRLDKDQVKFLLLSSWLCSLLTLGWLAIYAFCPSSFIEPCVCIGNLTVATAMLICIFIPKIKVLDKFILSTNQTGPTRGASYRDTTAPHHLVALYDVTPKQTAKLGQTDRRRGSVGTIASAPPLNNIQYSYLNRRSNDFTF